MQLACPNRGAAPAASEREAREDGAYVKTHLMLQNLNRLSRAEPKFFGINDCYADPAINKGQHICTTLRRHRNMLHCRCVVVWRCGAYIEEKRLLRRESDISDERERRWIETSDRRKGVMRMQEGGRLLARNEVCSHTHMSKDSS